MKLLKKIFPKLFEKKQLTCTVLDKEKIPLIQKMVISTTHNINGITEEQLSELDDITEPFVVGLNNKLKEFGEKNNDRR